MAGETVLAIDDREDSLKFLREYILEPNGYQMIQCHNGLEAMEVLAGQKVDLIISDLVMPKMGGLELLESLREKGWDIPTILMTFHGSEGTAVRAFRLGARDYIVKPFAIDEMLSAIDRALTESRLRQERDRLTQTVLRVNRQLEQRVQEMRFLYGIGRSVTSLQDLEQILNRIVEAAVYLTGAEEGSLMLIDQESGELYLRAERGMGQKNAQNLRIKIESSIAGQVVQSAKPVILGGGKEDRFKVKTGYFVRSLLNVPLKVKDQIIGVLAVHNKSTPKAFTDRHLHLLMTMADYASIAIDNARLYARLASDVSRARESSQALKKMVKARTDALNRVNQQLLQTEKLAALGYFAAGVTHEMRTPINVILDHLHQLEQRLDPEEENMQLLASLEQQALHCRQTIQSLLDFSGQKEYHPQTVDLNQIIESAWTRYANECDTTDQVEFVRGFDPNLPLVTVDSEQIKQALFYLIRNAYVSAPPDGLLRIITRPVGDQVQIIVSDNGRGITKEDLQHIFDPFYQATHQTYGMDLSIVQAVIDRHNGTIEVESEPGQGTTFTIHLPLKKDETG